LRSGIIADLRALKSRLPAIIITARPHHRNVAREAGVELLQKPLDLPLMLNRIRALLNTPQDGTSAHRR
jgi:DNA-binding response OmpR family regulator